MTETCQFLAAPCLFSEEDGWPQNNFTRAHFKCLKAEETENCFISSDCCQDPAQTVDTQDTEESIALFCQDKVGWSLQIPTPQESLSGLLGLAVEGWHCLGTSVPSIHGETRVAA